MTNEAWGVIYGVAWAVLIGVKVRYWDWPRRVPAPDPATVLFRLRSIFPWLRAAGFLLGVVVLVEGGWIFSQALPPPANTALLLNAVLLPVIVSSWSSWLVNARDLVSATSVYLGGDRYDLADIASVEPRGRSRIRLVWKTRRWGIAGFSVRPMGITRDEALAALGTLLVPVTREPDPLNLK